MQYIEFSYFLILHYLNKLRNLKFVEKTTLNANRMGIQLYFLNLLQISILSNSSQSFVIRCTAVKRRTLDKNHAHQQHVRRLCLPAILFFICRQLWLVNYKYIQQKL